ncbi:MAG: hypothetical protein ACI9CA_001105 [Natronomonas sp.]|jgi:hypothetical protein
MGGGCRESVWAAVLAAVVWQFTPLFTRSLCARTKGCGTDSQHSRIYSYEQSASTRP